MKLLFVLLLTVGLYAQSSDGETLFNKHCAQCHVKMITKAELLQNLSKLKAPPMVEISNRLRSMISVNDEDSELHRHVVIAFIKDYITYPDIEKSLCRLGALDRFGVMPSIGKKLQEEEKQMIAEWVYDYFLDKKFQ